MLEQISNRAHYFLFGSRLVVVALLMTGCGGEQFSVQMFTFPEEIPAHEIGWEYKGLLKVSSTTQGSMLKRSNKAIQITIVDRDENQLFESEHELGSVSGIKADIEWKTVDAVAISIIEYGSENVSDDYSESLARSGERVLQTIRLRLDRNTGRFSVAPES